MLVDGKVSKSKKESIWKLWVHHLSVAINKTAGRNVRKVTKMINDSNSDQRQATSSSFCEEVFFSVTCTQYLIIINFFCNFFKSFYYY